MSLQRICVVLLCMAGIVSRVCAYHVDSVTVGLYFSSSEEEFQAARPQVVSHVSRVLSSSQVHPMLLQDFDTLAAEHLVPVSLEDVSKLQGLPLFTVMFDGLVSQQWVEQGGLTPQKLKIDLSTLKKNVEMLGGRIRHDLNSGFTAALSREAAEALVSEEVEGLPGRPLVWADHIYRIAASVDGAAVRHELDQVDSPSTCNPVSWHLKRIASRTPNYSGDYNLDTINQPVKKTRVFVLDTGIRGDHIEFCSVTASKSCQTRVLPSCSKNFASDVGEGPNCPLFANDEDQYFDGQEHGTHVASSIGGLLTGVAKKVDLCAVRVLNRDGSGSSGDVIAGIQFADKMARKDRSSYNNIVSMSLGGGADSVQDRYMRYLIQGNDPAYGSTLGPGVVAVVAAGNDNANACNYSPARVTDAVTVGASTPTDGRASFSNWGSCVDIFAPGTDIYGANYTRQDNFMRISGTSMATPVTSGVAALIWMQNQAFTSTQVVQELLSTATCGAMSPTFTNDLKGSPNRLAYFGTAVNPSSSCSAPTTCNTAACLGTLNPSYDTCATPATITLVGGKGSTTVSARNADITISAQTVVRSPCATATGSLPTLFFSFQTTAAGVYTIDSCESQVRNVLTVWSACPTPSINSLACNLDGCDGHGSWVTPSLAASTSYIIAVTLVPNSGPANDIVVRVSQGSSSAPSCPATNDAAFSCTGYTSVASTASNIDCGSSTIASLHADDSVSFTDSLSGASPNVVSSTATCGNNQAANNAAAWYSYTHQGESRKLTFHTCSPLTSFGTFLSLFSGPCGATTLMGCSSGSSVGDKPQACGDNPSSSIQFQAETNVTYRLRLTSSTATLSRFTLTLTSAASPISFSLLSLCCILLLSWLLAM